jgi:hypothetical protein
MCVGSPKKGFVAIFNKKHQQKQKHNKKVQSLNNYVVPSNTHTSLYTDIKKRRKGKGKGKEVYMTTTSKKQNSNSSGSVGNERIENESEKESVFMVELISKSNTGIHDSFHFQWRGARLKGNYLLMHERNSTKV